MMMIAASPPLARPLPLMNFSYSEVISLGMRDKMLMSRTIEIPFPTPFSVIRSPIHIRNADPAVNVRTTIAAFTKLNFSRSP